MRFLRIDDAAAKQQFHHLDHRNLARQKDRRYRREHAQFDFRLAKLGVLGRHHHVAGDGQFATAAQRGPVDRRHGGYRYLHQTLEDAVEHIDHLDHLVRRVINHVNAGREGLVTVAGNDQDFGRGVFHRQIERGIHLLHGGDVQHVVWRPVDGEAQRFAVVLVGDEFEICHECSP